MEFRSREPVLLAADFASLVAWYRDTLDFSVENLFEDGFHYCNLRTQSGVKLGIASAKEQGIELGDRRRNAVVLQLEVEDVKRFFEKLEAAGAKITGAPSLDAQDGFWFGSFADLEGNVFWVVDTDCP